MDQQSSGLWATFQEKWLSRRSLIRGAAGTVLGAGLLGPTATYADDDSGENESNACLSPNPIPGGITALKPYGIFVHHNPLNPAKALADINDPSQITDFDGFVGLTHIRGGAEPERTRQARLPVWRFKPTWVSAKASLSARTVSSVGLLSPLFDLTSTPVRLDRLS
jgi:hypothetical protein